MLALSIFICNTAIAENNCIANQFSSEVRPSLQGIRNITDFYKWREYEHVVDASVAKIPLTKRPSLNGPSALAGFDIDDRSWQYDFLATMWSEGGCGVYKKTTEERAADNVYNFKFWQYLDIVYYFGHHLLTIPPTMWTNAAHKNGVLSLGTFNLNNPIFNVLMDSDHLNQTIQTLLDIAKTLGFDGYLINDEQFSTSINTAILTLMQSLKEAGLTIIWYDSPPSGGYANYLNDAAIPFFNSAGYFHANYWWGYPYGPGAPARSYQTLTKYHLEHLNNRVFQMGDAYRNPYKSDPLKTCNSDNLNGFFTRFNEIYKDESRSGFYSALGFYAPNWTLFGGKPDPARDTNVPSTITFEQSDAAFWEGSGIYGCGHTDFRNVSYFIEPRTVITSLPFFTSFNTGVGKQFFTNGKIASTGAWSNFTLQDILPTWQNVMSDTLRSTAKAYFDYDTAYEGGSSWKIQDATAAKDAATFKLFKTHFDTGYYHEIELVFKTTSSEKIQLALNRNQTLSAVKQSTLQNGWKKLIFKLPPEFTVDEIDIIVMPNEDGKININLGYFKLYTPGKLLIPENQIATQIDNTLSWSLKNPGSLFRIYGHKSDNSYTLLNEVANTSYELHGNIFNGNINISQFDSYLIQEVTIAGDYVNIPVSR